MMWEGGRGLRESRDLSHNGGTAGARVRLPAAPAPAARAPPEQVGAEGTSPQQPVVSSHRFLVRHCGTEATTDSPTMFYRIHRQVSEMLTKHQQPQSGHFEISYQMKNCPLKRLQETST